MARSIEIICATAAALLGAAAMAFALFAPTISTQTVASDGAVSGETHSMFDDGVEIAVIAVFASVAVLLLLLACAAVFHAERRAFRGTLPLWTPAIALSALVVLAGFSVGLLFLPSALLALAAAVAATRVSASPAETPH